ncbi:DUF6301 family protein [Catenuloplanes japonicus]|uniref:DUF6301 family protein n=1 Tax=Catenuloplanes japonicus TaxID=33876 RepID=UPI0005277C2B|nr:DUF6301 family protein [Catenuloplanes japonicus]
MADWKTAPDDAVRRLLTGLRAVSWPIPQSEADALLARLGWQETQRRASGVFADAGLGISPMEAAMMFTQYADEPRILMLEVDVTDEVLGDSPAEIAFRQDEFVRVVRLATEELGPPTERRQTAVPEVRWRDGRSSLAVVRSGIAVQVRMQDHAQQVIDDEADARALEAQA